MTNQKLSLKKGEEVAKFSSLAVALIGIVKGVVGFYSGSVALLAQAADSLTDVFASFTVYVGLKVAGRKPTERFPYGYYKAETFASLIVAAFIIVSGVAIMWESVIRSLQPEAVSFPHIALSVAAISIPFLYFLVKYNGKIGGEINSQAIVGQAKSFKLDMFSSMLVVIGILFSYLGAPWVEAVVGVIVSIFVLRAGIEIGKDAVLTLMDAILHPEKIAKMSSLAKEVQGVMGVRDVKIRKSGPFCFGEMVLEVEHTLSVEKAHAISDEVEQKLRRECQQLEVVMIHIEPVKRGKFRIAVSIEQDKGLDSISTAHFGDTSTFIFVDVEYGEIKSWVAKSTEIAKLSKKRGITAAKYLVAEKVSTLLAGEIGEVPFHVLRGHFVEIYTLQGGRVVREAITSFLNGELEKMVSSAHFAGASDS